MTGPLILRAARPAGTDTTVDLLLRDGRIDLVLPRGGDLPGDLPAGTEVVNLDGRTLAPGLWDNHVHFTQWVRARNRLDLSMAGSAQETLALVGQALADRPDATSALIGYGFRDSLWPDQPSLAALDALSPKRPVVLVSGDLHCGWVNSAAAGRLGIAPDVFGLVREADWLGANHAVLESEPALADVDEAARAAARRGVVGVVDFEYADNATVWPERVAAGIDSLRVHASVWPDGLDAAVAAGRRTGDALDPSGLITFGRLKVIVDGSLNTRTALCHDRYPDLPPEHPHPCGVESFSAEQLRDLLATAYANGIEAAVHAIGDRANRQVIDEFERIGQAGTVEHAQLVDTADLVRFGRLGLTASIQPEHAMDDRDVADRYWKGRTGRAYAYRSLHEAGAVLRLGSDAPVAPLDPWVAIGAAVSRARDGREAWHPEQSLPLSVALEASSRTRIAAGEPADLIVLDEDPFATPAEELRNVPVAATLLGGRWTWRNL